MHIGDLVSIETLFASYRKWMLDSTPFASVTEELESITATAAVEQRLFSPSDGDPVGRFGRMADAFDVSTAMPLAIYLATEPSVAGRLKEAFEALESYILRRDICGLTTKNYNRFFVALTTRLRACEGDKVAELMSYLSNRTADLDRWPDDAEWRRGWLMREQYKSARQPRLRYIFENIERAKHTALTEDIVIRTALTIEHIMPQKWEAAWPIAGIDATEISDLDPEFGDKIRARNASVNTLGNLTLLTAALNSTISNGPLTIKLPAIRANAALALNRELNGIDHWDEAAIQSRGEALFELARTIWSPPQRAEIAGAGVSATADWLPTTGAFPANGTRCHFSYSGREFEGKIVDNAIIIDGVEGQHASFSAASKAVTGTSRNGWNDWHIYEDGQGWVLANDWRKALST